MQDLTKEIEEEVGELREKDQPISSQFIKQLMVIVTDQISNIEHELRYIFVRLSN